MTCAQLLNTIGLVLSMSGVLIIFFFGPPQPNLEEGVSFGLEDGTKLPDGRTVAEHDADVKRRRRLHSRLSKLGLGLIFVGFACQLCAAWV
jgi:hypothetical protein